MEGHIRSGQGSNKGLVGRVKQGPGGAGQGARMDPEGQGIGYTGREGLCKGPRRAKESWSRL